MKSSKFRFFRLVALVIVMAQLLSLSTVVAFASSNDETIQQNETILPVESTITENLISTENVVLEPERELKPVISSDKFTTSEKIQLGFDKTDVIDYYYVANGVTVTEGTDNSMEFEIDAVDEFGSVDVYAEALERRRIYREGEKKNERKRDCRILLLGYLNGNLSYCNISHKRLAFDLDYICRRRCSVPDCDVCLQPYCRQAEKRLKSALVHYETGAFSQK